MRRIGLLLVTAAVTAGCGSNDSTGAQPAAPPPSPAPTHTAAPVPPAPKTALAVVRELIKRDPKHLRLSITYTAANDPNHLLGRPNGYVSKTAFIDTLVPKSDYDMKYDKGGVEPGGSIEYFATKSGAMARGKYVASFDKTPPLGNEYDYVDLGVLLRVTETLTPHQATKLKTALAAIMHHPATGPIPD